jgi:PAS domain S-box-containing protein
MNATPSALSKTIRIDVLPRNLDPATFSPGRVGLSRDTATQSQSNSLIRPEDYQRTFENAYDATLITDQYGAYINANRRVTELLGYDTESLQQIRFWQLISGADIELMETVRQSLASERFLRISSWCLRQDGSSFPAEIAVNQFLSGNKAYFCFFIRDETLRTQAEKQLRTVQNAVRNASAGIGMADLDGSIQYANTALASLFGEITPKQLRGQPLRNLLGNEQTVRDLIAVIQEGESACVEISHTLPNNITRWIQISAAPNLDSENALSGMVLSLVDISDRRRAEQAERVVERDRVMMESLGAVCHHLGQPATVLLSTLEMLTRMPDTDEETRLQLLAMSLEAAESLRKTLQDLNELRHYNAEPYPGPSPDRPASIIAIQTAES